jgi:hypothetical protein
MNNHDGQPCEKMIAVARGIDLWEKIPEVSSLSSFDGRDSSGSTAEVARCQARTAAMAGCSKN